MLPIEKMKILKVGTLVSALHLNASYGQGIIAGFNLQTNTYKIFWAKVGTTKFWADVVHESFEIDSADPWIVINHFEYIESLR
tara:strand:- start:2118 stop:2366 length:249 start_codon:yes stop_codon:yes gene_type:complete